MSPLWLIAAGFAVLAGAAGAVYLTRLFLNTRQHQATPAAVPALVERTATVDRLLDFSQTIQGAGRPDQIFATLSHFLRTELGLSGAAILTYDADAMPAIQLRSIWPESLAPAGGIGALAELDSALCPCLRQSLPRVFKPDGSPVRCVIDASLNLPPSHPAYCVPFTIGRKCQAVVHLLLPPGQQWTEQSRQLAQTYVNSAHSVLTTLNLLSEAEKQSMTDGLTGLFNRRSMDQLLQREVALSERHGHPLSLVMIDLDHFKEINDTHGHAAGDHMLRAFAECMRITLRKTDLAFRYGGDEFVIALPQTALAQAQQVVQKVRQAFMSVDFTHAIANIEQNPTLSIGVAERSKATNVLTLANLLAAADQALYSAKNSNRNCIRVYEPPQAA
jgi:diguanylate cyclase (GGDEF)-like protein